MSNVFKLTIYNKRIMNKTMVLLLDGSSQYDANVLSEIGNLIFFKHFLHFTFLSFSSKDLFYFTHVRNVF